MLHVGRNGIKLFLDKKSYQGIAKVKTLRYSRNYSSVTEEKSDKTFQEVINLRRSEAQRSIVVQVNSERSFPELCKYCSQFGEISEAHHYTIPHENSHYILIEYKAENEANEAIDAACHNEDLSGIPVRSPFLWFKAGPKNQKIQQSVADGKDAKIHLKTLDGTRGISTNELNDLLRGSESLKDQIDILYKTTCLNELGVRLRFLAARQVENSISGMFPHANAQLFGSSVNGFGKMRCDLDLVLRLDGENKPNPIESRLVFHTKENLANGRSQQQRQMESIGDMLQLFLPGVCSVRRILQARVPIIKYHHEHLDLEVDLSMSNLSGVYMSELLYMFGQIDSRVRPLTFCLRRWAQSVGLTNPSPGRWITNFSLTCLVIFFLQQLKQPILPSVNLLYKSATVDDIRVTEDGVNCSFLRNHRNIKFQKNNKSSIDELLLQFFEFYSQYDFTNRAISLNEGRSVVKPDHSAMYIINPLEQALNVSKNVSLEECERFRVEVRNAAWTLESEIENNFNKNENNEEISWGLLNLFKTPEQAIIHPGMFFKPRLVDVSDLFNGQSSNNNKNEKIKKIDYKNSQVRNQIENIKHKTKAELKQLKINTIQQSSSNAKARR